VNGTARIASGDASAVPLFYAHLSRKDLRWLISQMFKYSNNFMANQIFLTMGAERFGPPADRKSPAGWSTNSWPDWASPTCTSRKGSGLSRKTVLSARQMGQVLRWFEPHRELMVGEGSARFKTGTLSDVKALAGYLESASGAPLVFVVMLNGSGVPVGARERILSLLEKKPALSLQANLKQQFKFNLLLFVEK
jgi:D-alanyl-D-alanine carboxypeptidase/D-alanyl-D-alanine-endopeptidase (penicillin-binding protein 4)